MTTDTISTERLMLDLDAAEVKLQCAQELVARGVAWLHDHPRTHPQYLEAEARLAQRQTELAAARADVEAKEAALKRVLGALARPEASKSLNCTVCGQRCAGATEPGYLTHIACLEER